MYEGVNSTAAAVRDEGQMAGLTFAPTGGEQLQWFLGSPVFCYHCQLRAWYVTPGHREQGTQKCTQGPFSAHRKSCQHLRVNLWFGVFCFVFTET